MRNLLRGHSERRTNRSEKLSRQKEEMGKGEVGQGRDRQIAQRPKSAEARGNGQVNDGPEDGEIESKTRECR
jgi:hypothetical protein